MLPRPGLPALDGLGRLEVALAEALTSVLAELDGLASLERSHFP